MTPQLFRDCLVAAFGVAFIAPASEALSIPPKKLGRMVAGRERIYEDTVTKLVKLVAQRQHESVELLWRLRRIGYLE